MRKYIVLPLVLTSSISLTGNPMDGQYHLLTATQKTVLQKAYNYGKEYNLGYTLAAIAWQESFVGDRIVPINLDDPSAGLWHKNVNTALAEHPDTPQNGLQLNMMAEKLINDVEFAASLAIADLEHWKVIRNGDWMDIWASYNAGKYFKSNLGQRYAHNIRNKIRVLKRYLPNEPDPSSGGELPAPIADKLTF